MCIRDSETTWDWMGPQFYVRGLLLLREVGSVGDGTSVELTLLSPEGEEHTLTVESGDHEILRKLRPFPLRAGEAPLYLTDVDANYWMLPMSEHEAVYFQFNQVRDAARESIADFSARLRATLLE